MLLYLRLLKLFMIYFPFKYRIFWSWNWCFQRLLITIKDTGHLLSESLNFNSCIFVSITLQSCRLCFSTCVCMCVCPLRHKWGTHLCVSNEAWTITSLPMWAPPHDGGQEQAVPWDKQSQAVFSSHTQTDRLHTIDLLTSILILKHFFLYFLHSLHQTQESSPSLIPPSNWSSLLIHLSSYPLPPSLALSLKLPRSPPLMPIMGGNYGITATMTVQWELWNRDTRSCTMAKCCHQYRLLWLHRRALGGRMEERGGRENEGGGNKRDQEEIQQ